MLAMAVSQTPRWTSGTKVSNIAATNDMYLGKTRKFGFISKATCSTVCIYHILHEENRKKSQFKQYPLSPISYA